MSITDLARRVGLSRKATTAHIERGTVPAGCVERGPHGWVLVDADRAEQAIRLELEGPGRRVVRDDTDEGKYAHINFDNQATWPRDVKGLQIVREYWAAHAAKRKADVAARELVKTADVHRELFTAARLIRDQLVTYPDRVAADLSADLGVADAIAVRVSLQKTIDRLLTDLAAELERALVAAGAAGAAEDEDEDEAQVAEADGSAG